MKICKVFLLKYVNDISDKTMTQVLHVEIA